MPETEVCMVTGAPACGKSTLLKVLKAAAGKDEHFLFIDTSEIIRWHRERGTKWGRVFDTLVAKQANRDILPDEPIIEAVFEYIKDYSERVQGKLFHILLAGFPRSEGQRKAFTGRYQNAKLVHINCTIEQALHGTSERIFHGNARHDDGMEKLHHGWDEYTSKVLPAVSSFSLRSPDNLLCLDREERLRKKVGGIIRFLNIREKTRRAWLHEINDSTRPACQIIWQIEEESRLHHRAAHSDQSAHKPQTGVTGIQNLPGAPALMQVPP